MMRILLSVAIALSFSTAPVAAAQPKNIFEALFPKLKERRLKRQRAAAPVPVVKVSAPKFYNYRTAKRATVAISASPVVLAALETDDAHPDRGLASELKSEKTLFLSDLAEVEALKVSAEEHITKAVSDHYTQNPEYRWVDQHGEFNARARSVIKLFDNADAFGLRNSDYRLSDYVSEEGDTSKEAQRLHREIDFSVIALRYAMDASYGTVVANRLSGYHDLPDRTGEASNHLSKIMDSRLPANTLAAMHPDSDKFLMLMEELTRLQGEEDDVIELETAILIKPGQNHSEFPNVLRAIKKRASSELLAEHGEVIEAATGSTEYTKELVAVVKAYQKEAGLGADGIIGKNTATKLAGIKAEDKIRQVRMAMERLRWLPHELGNRHVFINQPEYRARYMESGDEKLSMRIVVGKKSNQTSFFYDEIEQVVYNPYWGVPRSIIVNEMLPKLRADPSYLDARGYELTNVRGQRISSSSVDWNSVGSTPGFDVRQPPGARNALGRVKIMFPNEHAIYMHDTPQKHLFKREHRAFSHGCVRLHDPMGMAAAVLGKSKDYVKKNISTGQNRKENLSVKVPVYVAYFTAWPQEDGSVKYFRDVYGRDASLAKAMQKTADFRNRGTSS